MMQKARKKGISQILKSGLALMLALTTFYYVPKAFAEEPVQTLYENEAVIVTGKVTAAETVMEEEPVLNAEGNPVLDEDGAAPIENQPAEAGVITKLSVVVTGDYSSDEAVDVEGTISELNVSIKEGYEQVKEPEIVHEEGSIRIAVEVKKVATENTEPTAEPTAEPTVEPSMEPTSEPVENTPMVMNAPVRSRANSVTTYANREVYVGEKINLSGSGDRNHSWTSSNSSIARVSGNGRTATVSGVSAGTVTITHRYKEWFILGYVWNKETFTVTVKEPSIGDGSDAYFYFLKPGKSAEPYVATNYWYRGMGKVELTDPKLSSNQNVKITSGVTNYISEYPNDVYSSITVDGKTYVYDTDGTGAVGTYSITWYKIVNSAGANNANSGTDQPITNERTWHVDGMITLNSNEVWTVNFMFKDVDKNDWTNVKNATVVQDSGDTLGSIKPTNYAPTKE